MSRRDGHGLQPSVCFAVQKVIGVSVNEGNERSYQVQWAPTWVSGLYLVGCENLIEEFLQEQSQCSNTHGEIYSVSKNRDHVHRGGTGTENLGETLDAIHTDAFKPVAIPKIQKTSEETSQSESLAARECHASSMRSHDSLEQISTGQNRPIEKSTVQNTCGLTSITPNLDIVKTEDIDASDEECALPQVSTYFKHRHGDHSDTENKYSSLEHVGGLHKSTSMTEQKVDDMAMSSFEEGSFSEESWTGKRREQSLIRTGLIQYNRVGFEREEDEVRNGNNESVTEIVSNDTGESRWWYSYDHNGGSPEMRTSPSSSGQRHTDSDYSSLGYHTQNRTFQEDDSLNSSQTPSLYSDIELRCVVCNKNFQHKHHLTFHLKSHHPETLHAQQKRTYTCKECGEVCHGIASYNQHCLTHRGYNSNKCTVCGKLFSSRGGLETHFRVHSGEKPFQCSVCFKRFSQKTSLKKHFRLHTGEKPYKCENCDKTFSDNSNHRIHSKRCNRKFTA